MTFGRGVRPGSDALSVLLLCDDKPHHAGTVLAHIDALRKYSRHHVRTFNPTGMVHPWYLKLNEFDVVVVHYSLLCSSNWYLHHSFREQLAHFRGLKVQFIQDEYRWIDEITAVVRDMGVQVLFTCIPEPEAAKVYGDRLPDVTRVPTLTGYVPESLLSVRSQPVTRRPIEIGYRAREIPFWLGTFARDKYLIAKGVLERAEKYGLRCDISWREADRLYGNRWVQFLASCRGTLGTGSGASIADFDGSIQRMVDEYISQNPQASFEEVHERVLKPFDGNLNLDVISPRIFESIALRTALVLFPGEYSGVVRPNDHYIPLEKDFSNFDDVVRQLRDDRLVTEMTDRAFKDVIAPGEYSYRRFVREFDRVLDSHASRAWHMHIYFDAARAARQARRAQIRISDHAGAALSVASRKVMTILPPSIRRFVQSPGSATVKGYLALRATAPKPERRAVVAEWFRSRKLRKTISMDVMFDDLLKLEVLQRARENRLTTGPSFRPLPRLRPDGAIEVTTQPGGMPYDGVDGSTLMQAIESGSASSMVWNHAEIGRCVWHALTPTRWIMLHLGTDGHHEFQLVSHLLAERSPLATHLLRPLLLTAEVPQSRATTVKRRPRHVMRLRVTRFPALRRFARAPGWYSIRLLLVLQRVAARPASRQLLWEYATNRRLRSSAPVDRLVEDLLKVDLLRAAWAHPNGFFVERHGGTYVSRTAATAPAAGDDQMSTGLVWDHTAIGNSISVPVAFGRRATVYLATDGRYAFSALAAIASAAPDSVAPLFPETEDDAEQQVTVPALEPVAR